MTPGESVDARPLGARRDGTMGSAHRGSTLIPGLAAVQNVEHAAPAVDAGKRSSRAFRGAGCRQVADNLVLPLLPRPAGRVMVRPAAHPRPLGGTQPRPRSRSDIPPPVGPPDGLPDVFGARLAPSRLPHLSPRFRAPRRLAPHSESLDRPRFAAVVR